MRLGGADHFATTLWRTSASENCPHFSIFHPIFHITPEQAERVAQLSNEDLIRFRPEDPISGVESEGGLSLTGGIHRTAEIVNRVKAGQLSPDTTIGILVHD